MGNQCVILTCEGSVTDPNMTKVEHYYGIEFTRGESNQGGNNGYHKMIGDATLLKEMRFHNQMAIVNVKDAAITAELNQTNWNKTKDGGTSVLDGSDGSDIMQVHKKSVYAIIGGSNATYERYIVSDHPFSYDGDEAIEFPAGGDTPDYAVLLDGMMRSIRNDKVDGTHFAGNGTAHTDSGYGTADAKGYPKTQLTRFQFEQYARAKNSDPSSNLPYTNICNFDLELEMAFMFIEFRTKNLNSVLGHGISSIAAPTADAWGKVTGFRLTNDGGNTYTYLTFGSNVYLPGSQTPVNMFTVLNQSSPVLKVFEGQLAVSNGQTLEPVKDADGNAVQGMSDGVMTGVWTKRFSFQLNASLTQGGEAKTYNVDAVLRVPIWRGKVRLWGNCSQWISGYELLHYLIGDTYHYKVYRAPSVAALTTDADVTYKTAEGGFAFEKSYEYVGEMPATKTAGGVGFGWAKKMLSLRNITTAIMAEGGGNIGTFENATSYGFNSATAGQYIRRGSHFGGRAGESICVLRYAGVNGEPSNSNTAVGSGFRVQLDD